MKAPPKKIGSGEWGWEITPHSPPPTPHSRSFHLLRLFNEAILPAIFQLLARSAGVTGGFAFERFVKLIAATIAAARRASSPSFCAASLAFRLSRNLAM